MNLSKMSINRPVFLSCLVALILLVGTLCLSRLGVDQFPDITFPVVVVTVQYTGASPEEVETLITRPMEEQISSVSGIKRLGSTSQEGLAVIVAEFTLGTDVKYSEQQVRDKSALAKPNLPDDAKDPIISRVDVSDVAIYRLSVSGDLPGVKLYDVTENFVKPRLEQVDGVGRVDIYGGTKREIKVEADRTKLKRREISIQALAQKIASSAQNVPVGKIDIGKNETVFRTIGEYKSIEQIKKTVLNFYGSDVAVSIGDVADVKDSVVDETNRALIDGKPSIFLDIHKQSGTNTVAVAESVQKKLEKINVELSQMPGKLKLGLVRDGAKFIRANVADVKESIILGIILAVAVVFLFLGNWRSTIITGLALPNSLLGAFIIMYLMGFTINVMTLLALSLAVGLLIDDAIVVRENIFRRLQAGESPKEAAENGTQEVTQAVVATTLTVIAVFLPVGFLSGTVGQFFKQFGLTIVFAMIISLFDALTMAPMLSAYFAGVATKPKTFIGRFFNSLSNNVEHFQEWLAGKYEKLLRFTVRRPGIILAISFVIFLFSLGVGRSVKSTFLPNSDNGEFSVNLEMPPGTSLDVMEETAKKVDEVLKTHKEIARTAVVVGNSTGESNKANIYVALTYYKDRKLLTTDLKGIVREDLKPFAYAKPLVGDVDIVGGNQRPFMINFSSDNLENLSKITDSIADKFKNIHGLVDVDTNYRLGKPEFQVILDPARATRYGVLSVQGGQELRTQMEGIVPAKFRENGQEYDIRVRLQPDQRNLEKYFQETYIPNINGNLISIASVSKGVLTKGPAKISRLNRSRSITIAGDLAPGGALGTIRQEAEKIIADEKLPPGVTYTFQGQAEDFQELIVNMLIAVGLAITFVYLILASLYESFITPLTIMLALPLAVVGGLLALFIFKESLNIFSMIGMIMLLGLVTKNSILLVDYTLQLIRGGMARNDAIVDAGKKRLRPILMTTIALIAGMIPVALGLSEAARSRTSMGIAIIGGLISSTLLTLVVVPAAFGFIDDFRAWWARILGNIFLGKSGKEAKS